MQIDSHQHFWKYNVEDFSWINQDMKRIKQDFLPQDLQKELEKTGFDGCVAVQARQSLEETSFLLNLADQNSSIKGVVGWVDLRSDDLQSQLDEFSKSPKFKGVRHVIQDEPDDKFILGGKFQKGISLLKHYDLTYDILVFPKHLKYVDLFVQAFPEQPFVIDHLAKPDIKNHDRKTWAADIANVARHTNVWCKLSGMVTEANWNKWDFADFKIYLDVVFEAFGEDRLMIGSDWPVCLLAAPDYKSVMEIVMDYIKDGTEETRAKILGMNAVNFYKL